MRFDIKEQSSRLDTTGDNDNSPPSLGVRIILGIAHFTLYIRDLKKRLGIGKDEPASSSFEPVNGHKLDKIFISKDKLPTDLDYPADNDDKTVLFQIKAQPPLPQLDGIYFDNQDEETANGIYLIAINKVQQGMTLYYLDKKTLQLTKVKDLKPLWWFLDEDEGVISLSGNDGKTQYDITVKEKV